MSGEFIKYGGTLAIGTALGIGGVLLFQELQNPSDVAAQNCVSPEALNETNSKIDGLSSQMQNDRDMELVGCQADLDAQKNLVAELRDICVANNVVVPSDEEITRQNLGEQCLVDYETKGYEYLGSGTVKRTSDGEILTIDSFDSLTCEEGDKNEGLVITFDGDVCEIPVCEPEKDIPVVTPTPTQTLIPLSSITPTPTVMTLTPVYTLTPITGSTLTPTPLKEQTPNTPNSPTNTPPVATATPATTNRVDSLDTPYPNDDSIKTTEVPQNTPSEENDATAVPNTATPSFGGIPGNGGLAAKIASPRSGGNWSDAREQFLNKRLNPDKQRRIEMGAIKSKAMSFNHTGRAF